MNVSETLLAELRALSGVHLEKAFAEPIQDSIPPAQFAFGMRYVLDAIERGQKSSPGIAEHEWCHRCGGENPGCWAVMSPLWNLVIRGGSIDGDPLYDDMVCIPCFIITAHEKGITGEWFLTLRPEPEGMEMVTPSGRIWDRNTFRWEEPSASAAPVVPPLERGK
jgi:hypothetical protein